VQPADLSPFLWSRRIRFSDGGCPAEGLSGLHVRPFCVGFNVADLADQASWSRRGGEAVVLVELAGVVVYGVDDDVPAARLLARRHGAGKGVVQQDPTQAGAAQLTGQGKAGRAGSRGSAGGRRGRGALLEVILRVARSKNRSG
jgi:hypothetical protein